MKSRYTWTWTACGKHPVAKDYFKLDARAPLFKAFSAWIEKGYQMMASNRNKGSDQYSWRFWAKGSEKNNVACGVVKDSCDHIGRPYPFLVLGTGYLERWEDHWELLPFAFADTWGQMEYLSVRRFLDFEQLEDGVGAIRAPDSNWSELESLKENAEESVPPCSDMTMPGIFDNAVRKPDALAEETQFFVPLETANDPLLLAGRWHSFLKTCIGGVPNAVFVGGVPQQAYLGVFRRPLVPSDFVRLWSSTFTGVTENGSFVTG